MIKLRQILILCSLVVAASCYCKADKYNADIAADTLEETSSDDNYPFVGEDPKSGDVTRRLYEELDSSEVYDDNVLLGFWFKPHEACGVNIFFHKGNKFEMHDYTVTTDDKVVNIYKTGVYKEVGDSIFMESEDGWKLAVRRWHTWKNDKNYYITKGRKSDFEIYLVKGSN